jgi:uncharacterized membrane protein YdbT with pleckstrin-like domain
MSEHPHGATLPGEVELRSGEHQLYEGRPSWRALMSFYVGGLILAALVLVVLGWLADSWPLAVIVAAIVAGLTLVVGYLRRVSTKYLITTQRLRISRGIVRRSVQETRLDRVQNVNYSQSVLDRVFRVGNVDFDTAGTDDSEFRFEWVNAPEKVVRAVDEAIHESGAARSATPGSLPPATPGSPPPA